ncbi:MAG: prepilin-type N-terminal cleavage/methylation domain-containing protein [Kiritimatiellia bacterium]
MRTCNGFSLVEVMIAMAIFGLLLAMALPKFSKARETARIEKAQGDLELIAAAAKQLAWDTGKWPGGQSRTDRDQEIWDLSTSSAGILSRDSGFDEDRWKGPYLDELPDDPWGSKYFFDPDYNRGGTNYIVVGSRGPNGTGPGPGSVANYDSDDIIVLVHRD